MDGRIDESKYDGAFTISSLEQGIYFNTIK